MAWDVVLDLGPSCPDQGTGTYSPKDGTVTIQFTQTYRATSDSKTDMAVGAYAAPGIPALGSATYFNNAGPYYCTQVQPTRDGPTSYKVQVQWTYTFTPAQSNNANTWNIQVRVSGSPYEQDAYQDKDQKAIVNSAGQPYDPTLKHTFNDEKIVVTYQSTQDSSSRFGSVRGKVNSGSVTLSLPGFSRSFDERQLRCDDVEETASIPMGDGTSTAAATPTYSVTASFTYRSDGFIDHVIDQGYYELDDDTGELVSILDKWGDPVNAPVLLDGNGHQLDSGADPVFKDYKIEEEADFTTAFTF